MAFSSRRSERHAINIWPGFVDALSQLIMVIIFVLLFFTAGQFFLTDALSGRDAALRKLTDQINQLTNILALEKQQNADLEVKVTQLAAALGQANAAREALQNQVQELGGKLQQSENDLAASRAREQDLTAQVQAEQQKSAAAETTAADLAAQIENLKAELARIGDALNASEAKNKEQQVQLADLGQRLNQALASRVEELARYRSEFFGQLRQILGNRPDIRVVGDRFVFQSEVLFAPGSAALSPDAQQRLAPVAAALKELAPKIPTDLPWVLQIAGHTDKTPIATAQFPSNWELSTARALSVVRYFVAQGIPADRLSAAGYGEFQPLDPANTPEAYSKNRRIELKLTER
ncbi:MAG TPA: peptidoglycan -binding protein [Stellaceae bacterium]|nr:peptidoglycan -binding protein [Stellaceae bacterium]